MSDPTDPTHPSDPLRDPDPLRDRLRAADPAAGLPPAAPEVAARRLEQTTADDATVESRSDGTQGRSRLTWVVAAAAVVLIAAGVGFVVVDRGGEDADGPGTVVAGGPGTGDDEGAATATVTDLSVDAGVVAGRCAPPSARVAAQQDVAVDAVVRSVSAGQVVLDPTRFYTGKPTDQVVVQEVSEDLQALLSAVDFTNGERYLVSASDGRVTLCGLSARWNPDLAAVYDQAFPS